MIVSNSIGLMPTGMRQGLLIFVLLAALFFPSCLREDYGQCQTGGDNSIVLNIAADGIAVKSASQGVESKIGTLDIFIFSEDGECRWHESHRGLADNGRIVLGCVRSSFDAKARYYVYLVANSRVSLEDVQSRTELLSMQQEDPLIHVTGLDIPNAPDSFLMDGAAYLSGSMEPSVPSPVVLNDGELTNDTELDVKLRRAAAKIIVNIQGGNEVKFVKVEGEVRRGYYLRNMPYSTTLLAESSGSASLYTPEKSYASGYYMHSDENKTVDIISYAYSHKWENASALEKQTTMLVNIPMQVIEVERDADGHIVYGEDGNPVYVKDANGEYVWSETKPENWYRVPVSRTKELKRNTCYQISLLLNAPGGNSYLEPIELKEINYEVLPWEDVQIGIGGESDRPKYLTLNRESFEMHYIADDNMTMEFASSSKVSVTVKEAYYFDKLGKKTAVSANILRLITATLAEDGSLGGKINVHSPVPENNAVRTIVFTVTNEDGISREFTVDQYPLEYITNVQGWYSYRDDFYYNNDPSKITNYEFMNGLPADDSGTFKTEEYSSQSAASNARIDGGGGRYTGANWSNGGWTFANSNPGNNFFSSKVAVLDESTGKSAISYYYWSESLESSGFLQRRYWYEYNRNTTNISTLTNARMYHVVISSTSSTYIVGVPRLVEKEIGGVTYKITDSSPENAKLVSPSFMIASQLGAVLSVQSLDMAATHCANYVEISRDGKKYDDWRLPTRSEIEIIYKFQYTENAAMDEVLSGAYYWCADSDMGGSTIDYNKLVKNPTKTGTGHALRCVRDAY